MNTDSNKQAQKLYEGWTQTDIAFRHKIQSKVTAQGISGSQLEILFAVHHIGKSVSVKNLAEVSLKTSSAVTQLVANLEKKGYVVRKHSKSDRRVVHVGLTKTGSEKLSAIQSIVIDEIKEIISTLSKAEISEYIRINNKIASNT